MNTPEDLWTKEQYLHWLANRGEVGQWNIGDCRKADQHIEYTTLENLKRILAERHTPQPETDFILVCAWAHFGSVETDDFCKALNAYPDYTERSS